MTGLADAVGEGLSFAHDLFKYFLVDADGWARLSVEDKLETLYECSKRARAEKNWAAVDRLVAEYHRLQVTTA